MWGSLLIFIKGYFKCISAMIKVLENSTQRLEVYISRQKNVEESKFQHDFKLHECIERSMHLLIGYIFTFTLRAFIRCFCAFVQSDLQ